MAEELEQGTEAAEGTDGAAEAGKGKKPKMMIVALLAVLLIGGAGAGAYFFMSSKKEATPTEEGAAAEGEEHAAEAEGEGGEHGEAGAPGFLEMDEILVNLSAASGGSHYLKLKLNIEVSGEKELEELKKIQPRIMDDFQVYLRQLRVDDVKGAAGVHRLKETLLLRANQAAYPLKIKNVLLKEFLVQ